VTEAGRAAVTLPSPAWRSVTPRHHARHRAAAAATIADGGTDGGARLRHRDELHAVAECFNALVATGIASACAKQ
jgi:hypothetical protein